MRALLTIKHTSTPGTPDFQFSTDVVGITGVTITIDADGQVAVNDGIIAGEAIPVATTLTAGVVKLDGTTSTLNEQGQLVLTPPVPPNSLGVDAVQILRADGTMALVPVSSLGAGGPVVSITALSGVVETVPVTLSGATNQTTLYYTLTPTGGSESSRVPVTVTSGTWTGAVTFAATSTVVQVYAAASGGTALASAVVNAAVPVATIAAVTGGLTGSALAISGTSNLPHVYVVLATGGTEHTGGRSNVTVTGGIWSTTATDATVESDTVLVFGAATGGAPLATSNSFAVTAPLPVGSIAAVTGTHYAGNPIALSGTIGNATTAFVGAYLSGTLQGGARIAATVTGSTWTATYTPTSAGSYTFDVASPIDGTALATTSAASITNAPVVSGTIVTPTGSLTATTPIAITGTVTNTTTAWIGVYLAGTLQGSRVAATVTSGNWSGSVTPASAGSYTFDVAATQAGAALSTTGTVTIGAAPVAAGTVTPPVGSVYAGNILSLSGTVSNTAGAAWVGVYLAGVLQGSRGAATVTSGAWSIGVTPSSAGSYTFDVAATQAGAALATSSAVTVIATVSGLTGVAMNGTGTIILPNSLGGQGAGPGALTMELYVNAPGFSGGGANGTQLLNFGGFSLFMNAAGDLVTSSGETSTATLASVVGSSPNFWIKVTETGSPSAGGAAFVFSAATAADRSNYVQIGSTVACTNTFQGYTGGDASVGGSTSGYAWPTGWVVEKLRVTGNSYPSPVTYDFTVSPITISATNGVYGGALSAIVNAPATQLISPAGTISVPTGVFVTGTALSLTGTIAHATPAYVGVYLEGILQGSRTSITPTSGAWVLSFTPSSIGSYTFDVAATQAGAALATSSSITVVDTQTVAGTVNTPTGTFSATAPIIVNGSAVNTSTVWIGLYLAGTLQGSRISTTVTSGSWSGSVTPASAGTYTIDIAATQGGAPLVTSGSVTVGAPINLMSGLVGDWSLSEGTGTTAADSSASPHNGTLVGSPSWTTGPYGPALAFNGINQYVSIPANKIVSGLTNWTIATQFKSPGYQSGKSNGSSVFYGERGPTGNNIVKIEAFYDSTHHKPLFTMRDDGGTLLQLTGNANVATNTWTSMIVTKSGNNISMYINGVLDSTATWTGTNNFTQASGCYIGWDGNDSQAYLYGSDCSTLLYNRSLSAQEASALSMLPSPDFVAAATITVNTGTVSVNGAPISISGTSNLQTVYAEVFSGGVPVTARVAIPVVSGAWSTTIIDPVASTNVIKLFQSAVSITALATSAAYTQTAAPAFTAAVTTPTGTIGVWDPLTIHGTLANSNSAVLNAVTTVYVGLYLNGSSTMLENLGNRFAVTCVNGVWSGSVTPIYQGSYTFDVSTTPTGTALATSSAAAVTGKILGPTTVYNNNGIGSFTSLGSFLPRGLPGVLTATLSGPDYQGPSAGAVFLGGLNNLSIMTGEIAYQSQFWKNSYSYVINITNGTTTLSMPFTVLNSASFVAPNNNFVFDTAPQTAYAVPAGFATLGGYMAFNTTGTITLTDPSNTFTIGLYNQILVSLTPPLNTRYGAYPVVFNDASGGAGWPATLYIVAENEPQVVFTPESTPLYSSIPPRETNAQSYATPASLFGSLLTYSDTGVASTTVPGNPQLAVSAATSQVFVVAPLTPITGDLQATITSNSGMSVTVPINYTVLAGTTLTPDSTNVTFTAVSGLTNALSSAAVAATVHMPTLTAPTWTVDVSQDECQLLPSYFGGLLPRYSLNATDANTVQVMANYASAQTDHVVVTGTGTDGAVCQVSVPIVYGDVCATGPHKTVGPSSSGTYDYPTVNAALDAYWTNPVTMSGMTLTLAQQDYSHDFSRTTIGHGSNQQFPPGPIVYQGISAANRTLLDFKGNAPGLSAQGGVIAQNFDHTIKYLDIRNVTNNNAGEGNAGGLYKTNGTPGNVTITNCAFSNCDICIMNGDEGNHFVLTDSWAAFGGAGAGGLTHNIYLGHYSSATVTNLLSFSTAQVHEFKTRAARNTLRNVQFYDGLNGSPGASCGVDMPLGGINDLKYGVIQRGPNPNNNGHFIQVAVEIGNGGALGGNWANNATEIDTFTFLNTIAAPALSSAPTAVTQGGLNNQPYNSVVLGTPATTVVKNCQFYNLPRSQWMGGQGGGISPIDGGNNTPLLTWPGITAIDPGTGALITQAPGPDYFKYMGAGWGDLCIDPLTLQLLHPAGTGNGQPLCTITYYGINGIPRTGVTYQITGAQLTTTAGQPQTIATSTFAINSSGQPYVPSSTTIVDGLFHFEVTATGTDATTGVSLTASRWLYLVGALGTVQAAN